MRTYRAVLNKWCRFLIARFIRRNQHLRCVPPSSPCYHVSPLPSVLCRCRGQNYRCNKTRCAVFFRLFPRRRTQQKRAQRRATSASLLGRGNHRKTAETATSLLERAQTISPSYPATSQGHRAVCRSESCIVCPCAAATFVHREEAAGHCRWRRHHKRAGPFPRLPDPQKRIQKLREQ